jgi:predicted RNA-binding protein with PIN domain
MQLLIIDGHSVIFQWPELRGLHDRKGFAARERLVHLLSRYQDISGVTVAVVFDGKGKQASKDAETNTIQVFYSKSGQTADSIIERLVAKYATSHQVVVATDDFLERQTVEAFGGLWMSTDQLRAELARADGELGDQIDRLNRRR